MTPEHKAQSEPCYQSACALLLDRGMPLEVIRTELSVHGDLCRIPRRKKARELTVGPNVEFNPPLFELDQPLHNYREGTHLAGPVFRNDP
jgi:hypothetical protein